MTFTPIPDGIRVVHLGQVGAVQVINTVGASNGDGSSGSSLDSIAKAHGDAWRLRILPLLSSEYKHLNTVAYSLEDASLAAGDAKFVALQAGGAASGPESLNVCMVVQMRTAKRGRTYQGRMFISALPQLSTNADGITWQATKVAAMQTAFNSYKGDVDPALGHNGRLAVCSKGSPSKGIAPHQEPVTSVRVVPAIGTQRRRLY